MGMIIDFKTKGKIESKADPAPLDVAPVDGTVALAQPAEARYKRWADFKLQGLRELLTEVENFAMRACTDWDEAIEMQRLHLIEQTDEFRMDYEGRPDDEGLLQKLVSKNEDYLDRLDKAEEIYNVEFESVRPLIAVAHERFAARVESELGLDDLADAVRTGFPLKWLDWS